MAGALLIAVLAAILSSSLASSPFQTTTEGLRTSLEIGLLMAAFLVVVDRTGFLLAATALLFVALLRLKNRWWVM